jgi:hypothetical protein
LRACLIKEGNWANPAEKYLKSSGEFVRQANLKRPLPELINSKNFPNASADSQPETDPEHQGPGDAIYQLNVVFLLQQATESSPTAGIEDQTEKFNTENHNQDNAKLEEQRLLMINERWQQRNTKSPTLRIGNGGEKTLKSKLTR